MYVFNEMEKPNIHKKSAFVPYENRSIKNLFLKIYTQKYYSDEEKANILTHFYLKLAMSTFSFLILFALPPYLFRFTRKPKTFLITTISLFSFIALFTLIDSAAILGENQVITPLVAICIPFFCLFGFFGINFLKMK